MKEKQHPLTRKEMIRVIESRFMFPFGNVVTDDMPTESLQVLLGEAFTCGQNI